MRKIFEKKGILIHICYFIVLFCQDFNFFECSCLIYWYHPIGKVWFKYTCIPMHVCINFNCTITGRLIETMKWKMATPENRKLKNNPRACRDCYIKASCFISFKDCTELQALLNLQHIKNIDEKYITSKIKLSLLILTEFFIAAN